MTAAPLASSSGTRRSPGRLLTEAHHRPDALAPVPQPQGRQVPADHLHLAVQLHPAGTPATGSPCSALKLPLSRPTAPPPGPSSAGCPGICLPARGADVPVSSGSGSTSPAGADGVPSSVPDRVYTVAADRGHRPRRIRLAPPEPGDRRGRHVLSQERALRPQCNTWGPSPCFHC